MKLYSKTSVHIICDIILKYIQFNNILIKQFKQLVCSKNIIDKL